MRCCTLLLLCLIVSLSVSAHAQQLADRGFCDHAPVTPQVTGQMAPKLIGSDISQFAAHGVEARRIAVNGSEARDTIVNQWPKPGDPVFNGFLLLCYSAGNLPAEPPPQQPEPKPGPTATGKTSPEVCNGEVDPTTGKCLTPGGTETDHHETYRRCRDNSQVPAGSICQIAVPDVSNETEQQAISVLTQSGFSARPDCCAKSDVPKGKVAFTNPGAGERIPEGSPVIYELSSGPGWPAWLVVLAGIASLGLLGAVIWLAVPKHPTVTVNLPPIPRASVTWGEPITPEIDVVAPAVTSRVELPPYKERDR